MNAPPDDRRLTGRWFDAKPAKHRAEAAALHADDRRQGAAEMTATPDDRDWADDEAKSVAIEAGVPLGWDVLFVIAKRLRAAREDGRRQGAREMFSAVDRCLVGLPMPATTRERINSALAALPLPGDAPTVAPEPLSKGAPSTPPGPAPTGTAAAAPGPDREGER